MTGWSAAGEYFCDKAPVAKGKMAAPSCPKAAMNPIELAWSLLGMTLVLYKY